MLRNSSGSLYGRQGQHQKGLAAKQEMTPTWKWSLLILTELKRFCKKAAKNELLYWVFTGRDPPAKLRVILSPRHNLGFYL